MKRLLAPAIITAAALAISACGSNDGDDASAVAAGVADSTPTGSSASSAATSTPTVDLVQVEDFGVVLADADGRVLYAADEEADPDVLCTDACEEFWQPLDAGSAQPTGAPGVTDLGVADRPDGTSQVTFDGRRLYTFTLDSAGEATGDGFSDTFGGQRFTWHVVVAETSAAGTPATSPGTDDSGSPTATAGDVADYPGY
jgi:predicted lipoprotein with Yx(FWY)xxD motif